MARARKKNDEIKATKGPWLDGALPDPVDCPRLVMDSPPLCSEEEWTALGRPVITIRYGLAYKGEVWGHVYCTTYLRPCDQIAARLTGPSNCKEIDIGIVTPGGSHWRPARVALAGDDAAATSLVARRLGRGDEEYYWDYSLTEETATRYLDSEGRRVCDPQMSGPGEQPDDPGCVLGGPDPVELDRLADDGGPHYPIDPEDM